MKTDEEFLADNDLDTLQFWRGKIRDYCEKRQAENPNDLNIATYNNYIEDSLGIHTVTALKRKFAWLQQFR